MSSFFKFPSTPHLISLGESTRGNKVMSRADRDNLLQHEVIIEEKLDGANIGISKSIDGNIQVQNRGSYIIPPFRGQFSRLRPWLAIHRNQIDEILNSHLILFGEWCAAQHSVEYSSLSDLFFLFDVYDLKKEAFWNVARRNALADLAGLEVPPRVSFGKLQLNEIVELLERTESKFTRDSVEGFMIRRDSQCWNLQRAKLVRKDFTQAIDKHWSKRILVWNGLASP